MGAAAGRSRVHRSVIRRNACGGRWGSSPVSGETAGQRAATGGLGGAATGAVVGGPTGAAVGGAAGAGAVMDEGADEKVDEALD